MFLFASAPAKPDWRQEIGVFRIGVVVPANNPLIMEHIEPFRAAMADGLDMDVEYFRATSATPLIEAIAAGRIEYAVVSASAYALTDIICECVEPLVAPRAIDSTDSYHLIGLTRKGEAVSFESLANKKTGIISDQSVTGGDFVKFLLKSDKPWIDFDGVELLSEGSSETTIRAFLEGKYDVLFGWSSMTGDPSIGYSRGTLNTILATEAGSGGSYDIFWKSKPIAHRPHVIRKNLPGELKSKLKEILFNLNEDNSRAYDVIEPVYGGGFSSASPARFDPMIRFFRSLKNANADSSSEPEVNN